MNNAEAQLTQLALQRDTLLESTRNGFFQHAHSPEERHDLYKKMGLRVLVDRNGDVTISGSLLPYDAFVAERCMSTYEVRRKPFAS